MMDVPTYSREMGGIRSDGQLYELQRRMQQETQQSPQPDPVREQVREQIPEQIPEESAQETVAQPPPPPPPKAPDRGGILGRGPLSFSFLRDLKMDDLLLLAIGFLLLTDSGQERNDLLFLLIGLLLLF